MKVRTWLELFGKPFTVNFAKEKSQQAQDVSDADDIRWHSVLEAEKAAVRRIVAAAFK